MSTWLEDAWYVAGWDGEIASAPMARTICGVPMMFYRKLDGSVVAMRDAYPHRMLPLSMGIREGDSIRCKYHGLKIGPDGGAQEMPLKSDPVNTRVCAETYATFERHRFVWVWIGNKAKADPELIPDLWPCSADGWTFDGGYYHVECDYRLMIDVGVAPVGAGATLADHDQGVRGMVVDCMTPETETSHHYFWGMARNFESDDAGATARLKAAQGGVFAEDKVILEAQKRAINANPDLKLNPYAIDQGGIRARQIITRSIKAQTEAAT